ncbi:MAG: FHA domain-containing protein [Anaeromyxobacter sp.]
MPRGPHRLAFGARDAPREEAELASAATAGGSAADAIHLAGLPPAALRLEPCPAGVVVTATIPGVRVAGHAVPPGGRRLLRPGERAEAAGTELALADGGAPVHGEAGGTRAAAGALIAGAAPHGPALVVLTGPLAGARTPLRGAVVVGRGRGAGLRLPDPELSRRHARVAPGERGATVLDLGSKNGVRVNGVRIERRPVPLAPGDELLLGGTAVALEGGDPPGPPPGPASHGPPAHGRDRGHGLAAAAVLLALGAAALAAAALP